MKHQDELQPFSPEKHAKREKYLGNFDQLVTNYEHLLVRSKRESKQVVELRNELTKYKKQLAVLQSDAAKVRAENQKLKDTLKALRLSKTVRAGRAVTLPARIIKKTVRASVPRPRALSNVPVGPVQADPASAATSAQMTTLLNDDRALSDSYWADVEKDCTKENILRYVNHAYFVLGDISRPASVLRANEALLTDLNTKDARLTRVLLGLDGLIDNEPQIPPRQPNAGFLVERNRVLYCAHSTGHFNSNGYSTRTAGIIRGLTDQGKDVVTMARPGYPWDVKVDVRKPPVERFVKTINDVEHVYNPCLSWTDDRLDHYLLASIDTYVREAQHQRPAVIHAASNYVTALPALIAARRLGIPFAYEVRGLWEVTGASERNRWEESERYKLSERMETLVASHADHVFAITPQIRDELVRRGVDPSKISLLPNAVDTNEFTPMPSYLPLKTKLDIPDEVPVIGYAGSLVGYEGISDLLNATRIIVDAGRDIRVVLVGDGPELANLKTESTRLGLTGTVIFTGRVPATEISKYISVFDVMPCPRLSLPVTELVSPLKPLEAMACAKAMVVTRVAPLIDLAGANEDRGILVEPSNHKSLAEGILRLLDDPELRKELGRRSRLWTVRERTWRLTAGHIIGAYKDVQEAQEQAVENARTLREIRMAIVADTFTTEGLRPEVDLVELRPDSWQEQLEQTEVDALFVESAWEGADNEWHQRVGYYGDEKFSVMHSILEYCRERSIPTIFWNKEDPVHYNRFKDSAKHFDHIFSTDADCISSYAKDANPRVKSIGSLPFYAQPLIHNPLPSGQPHIQSVAYAGTFYGDRYKERSRELGQLLEAAKPFGLTIYDRQLLNENSPYQFPAGLRRYVSGGLNYLEMVKAYKSHPVHINVNSVASSPTMFSRRVMEIAASGSTIISGRGRGVDEVMAGLVHTVESQEEAAVLAKRWMSDEEARIHDAWLAYRFIHRGHTAAHRLTYVLRTAGLIVEAPAVGRYALVLDSLSPSAVAAISEQTVLPTVLVYDSVGADTDLPSGITAIPRPALTNEFLVENGITWIGPYIEGLSDRTAYEDLLTANRYGRWDKLTYSDQGLDVPGLTLAITDDAEPRETGHPMPLLARIGADGNTGGDKYLRMRRSVSLLDNPTEPTTAIVLPRDSKNLTILVAGHDLKFARAIIAALERQGHEVLIDRWAGHAQHDEERSSHLLAKADVVFCEWTLGNAVWYAENVEPHQRLVTRLHSQELFTPYLKMVKHERIDQILVVGQHVADIASRDHGIPAAKMVVVPNAVDVPADIPAKDDAARYRLGMVGIVPAQKNLNLALDLLSALRKIDRRFTLAVKGKKPEDYPWMSQRPEEMEYYAAQYERMRTDPDLIGAVTFDGYGDDMSEWYQGVGVVISVSDFESFHLTIADGAAHGALPVILAWPGSDQIYPPSWISASIDEMVSRIYESTQSDEAYGRSTVEARTFVEEAFSSAKILPKITSHVIDENIQGEGYSRLRA